MERKREQYTYRTANEVTAPGLPNCTVLSVPPDRTEGTGPSGEPPPNSIVPSVPPLRITLTESCLAKYWVFRSWGRVGTTIGGNKLDKFSDKNAAIDNFLSVYEEKTGNSWHSKNFTKYPNKFYPLEIDYGQDEEAVKKLTASAGTKSKLAKPVQELIKMIFDVESMKKAMTVSGGGSDSQILDLSNRFYTLIPHDFGMKKPPLLNNLEYIQTKVHMLDNLLDIEVAYSLLRGGAEDDQKDPIDINYEKLKTKIEVVDKESKVFNIILDYVKNTHAATHNSYSLEVEDIFEIVREGEYQRYKPFQELPNRQLLWHGSRTTNFAGILSQGLRIAPPEAPVTGYMFGKGVYFADMVSKSANYCHTSQADPVGLILLGELALGNMHELKKAAHISKLPKGKHSVKGALCELLCFQLAAFSGTRLCLTRAPVRTLWCSAGQLHRPIRWQEPSDRKAGLCVHAAAVCQFYMNGPAKTRRSDRAGLEESRADKHRYAERGKEKGRPRVIKIVREQGSSKSTQSWSTSVQQHQSVFRAGAKAAGANLELEQRVSINSGASLELELNHWSHSAA
ncbi:UNVERIFIED_CONTAM: hypothetical protein FKN15_041981 [Acipenser sinensis]